MARFASRFGLDSLMLVIVLVAACAAVMRESPPLGIFLAILAAVALSRTAIQIARNQDDEVRMSAFDKVIAFFVSVAVVLLIGIPAFVVFAFVPFLCHSFQIHPMLCLVGGVGLVVGVGFGVYRAIGNALKESTESEEGRRY